MSAGEYSTVPSARKLHRERHIHTACNCGCNGRWEINKIYRRNGDDDKKNSDKNYCNRNDNARDNNTYNDEWLSVVEKPSYHEKESKKWALGKETMKRVIEWLSEIEERSEFERLYKVDPLV
jgi:hypothetical protein